MGERGGWMPAVLALFGAAVAILAAAFDLVGVGYPGLGRTQVAMVVSGAVLIAGAHVLSRARQPGGLGVRDVPWLAGLATMGVVGSALLATPPVPSANEAYSLDGRLLDVERVVRTPRRGLLRCYPPTDGPPPPVRLEPVATGFVKPVFATLSGDGTGRLFVAEKGGAVRVVENGTVRSEPFLDLRDRVISDDRPPAGWEQGLLSIAFDPEFSRTGRMYVFYTSVPDATLTISRFVADAARERIVPSTEEVILAIETVGPDHNGGQLMFGDDGYLYVSVGDGNGYAWPHADPAVYGDGAVEYVEPGGDPIIAEGYTEADITKDDPWGQAQDPATLRGTILRLDVSGDSGYVAPPDNPFAADGDPDTRPEIWAYGFRNPYRFSFDPCDGALFTGDVGRAQREEVDLVVPGGNYGWPIMEGSYCYPPGASCNASGLEFPIHTYAHLQLDPAGGQAVVGGRVYRGSAIPGLVGRYVFGDFLASRVWALTPSPAAPTGWRKDLLLTLDQLPTSFGVDADGELLVVDYQGGVYRLVAAD